MRWHDAYGDPGSALRAAAPSTVDVRCADAGDLASYVDVIPADLVLMAGVFGNIGDVRRTVATLPHLCRPGGTVIWTRSRREPDLTGSRPLIDRLGRDVRFANAAAQRRRPRSQ